MLGRIQDTLYTFIVNSGIVWFLMPIVKFYVLFLATRSSNTNHRITDDEGSYMNTTKLGDKIYPPFGKKNFSKVKNLKMRENDVLICGYPKTGCHWTFEITRMLLNKSTSLSKYGKGFEGYVEFLPEFLLDSIPSPRILNTHISYDDLPQEAKIKKTKIILTTRCPKDTVVSYYHHMLNLKEFLKYDGKFENFFKLFMSGELTYGSYFDNASDWRRVMTSPTTPNPIFLLKYEELKSKPVEMIKKLARFLGVDESDTFIEDIARRTQFQNMKSDAKNDFHRSAVYRKGIVGDWKNWLSDEQNAEMDARKEVLLG